MTRDRTTHDASAGPPAGFTAAVAAYAHGSSSTDLPHDVAEMAKMCILDSLSAMVVGRHLLPGKLAQRYAHARSGLAEASIVGGNFKATVEIAAFANGTAAHANEIDDVGGTHNHPGAAVVPAVLALSEQLRATGADVLNAVTVGYQVSQKVVRAVGPQRTLIQRKNTLGDSMLLFGAAAAAGGILGLSEPQHRHAFALASMHAGAIMAFMDETQHISKAVNLGNAAREGVVAATFAAMGFEGNDSVFEARKGVFDTWADEGPQDWLAPRSVDDFEIMKTSFKFFSAGYPIQAAVEGVLNILRQNNLSPDDLDRVTVGVTTYAGGVVNAGRSTPSINMVRMVALAIVADGLGFDVAHDPAWLSDPRVNAMERKVDLVFDADLDRDDPDGSGAIVTVNASNGRTVTAAVPFSEGDYRRHPRISWDALAGKFRDICTPYMASADIAAAIEIVKDLDSAPDVTELMDCVRRTTHVPA